MWMEYDNPEPKYRVWIRAVYPCDNSKIPKILEAFIKKDTEDTYSGYLKFDNKQERIFISNIDFYEAFYALDKLRPGKIYYKKNSEIKKFVNLGCIKYISQD